MTEKTFVVPEDGRARATIRSAVGALLERARGWWARPARSAPAHLWEAAVDATSAFRPGHTGLSLTCRAGTFLVTQERDPVDHVLEAGDRFWTTSRGRVLAWALRAGTLGIEDASAHLGDTRSASPNADFRSDAA